jgi:hypothetical protein
MPATVTITAKAGPNLQTTTGVFSGLTGVLILPDRRIIQLFTGGDTNSPPEKEFDLTGTTSISGTIGGTAQTLTLTIS